MRVLDLGSGAGDVAFVAAELVGPTGEVIGVDQSPDSIARAKARAAERGLSNVRFLDGDIHDQAPDGPFDAITCRLVLMYVPDPAAVIRTQAAGLRFGGVIAPIEFDLPSARSPLGMVGVQPHFGPEDPDGAAILGGIVRTALPLIEGTGVATRDEVGADTFQQRLADELASATAVFAHPILMCAWGATQKAS